jgi:PadR family transcriptional regulator, regulatory protein PadR
MNRRALARVDLLRGTLDVLILRTLMAGPNHGHAIAKHIRRTSEDLLQVESGSLYPALHRLEAKGWIAASWDLSDKGKRARYYRLTVAGRKQLASEQAWCKQTVHVCSTAVASTPHLSRSLLPAYWGVTRHTTADAVHN